MIANFQYFVAAAAFILIFGSCEGCPGYCSTDAGKCKEEGGVVTGEMCSPGEYCCDNTETTVALAGSCGANKHKGTHPYFLFQSPEFPFHSAGDLLCTYTFELEDGVVGVLIDFEFFETDSVRIGIPSQHGCDLDAMYIKGFQNWSPPAYCGELQHYRVLIDDAKLQGLTELRLIALMSSPRYRWSIKITQILSEGCPNLSPGNIHPAPAEGSYDTTVEERRKRRKRAIDHQNALDFNRPRDGIPIPAMVGGVHITTVAKATAPWQASIRLLVPPNTPGASKCDIEVGKHVCGGAVISDREILTTINCFQRWNSGRQMVSLATFKVRVGTVYNCGSEPAPATSQVFGIASVTGHYAYDKAMLLNELAIVRLTGPINFNGNVQPVPLAHADDVFWSKDAIITGWGNKESVKRADSPTTQLQYAANLVVETPTNCEVVLRVRSSIRNKDIFKQYEKFKGIPETFICTRSKLKTSDVYLAPGDIGSPVTAVRKGTTERVLAGVVSASLNASTVVTGKGKDQRFSWTYHVSQSVANFRRWIDIGVCMIHAMAA